MWFLCCVFVDSAQWTRIQVQSIQRGQNREGTDCWAASVQAAASVIRYIQQTSFLPGKHFMDQKWRQISNNNIDPIARRRELSIWTQSIFFYLPVQVSVYQVLDITKKNTTLDRKLLSSRLIPIHSNGWEVFTITQAVSVHCLKSVTISI